MQRGALPTACQRVAILHSDLDAARLDLADGAVAVQRLPAPACSGVRCPVGRCLPPSSVCNGAAECRWAIDESIATCGPKREACEPGPASDPAQCGESGPGAWAGQGAKVDGQPRPAVRACLPCALSACGALIRRACYTAV